MEFFFPLHLLDKIQFIHLKNYLSMKTTMLKAIGIIAMLLIAFSYVGCKSQKEKVSQTQMNVPEGKVDISNLQEHKVVVEEKDKAVVVGYGARRKSAVTCADVDVSADASNYLSAPAYSYDSEKNEEYSSFAENRFKDAKSDPLSTFSLDVDVASYSNIRRMINQGQKPTKDAVRVEEFINYFSYDYPNPTGQHPINILTETQTCPWNKNNLLVRIGVKAKEIPSENIPSSNFVFLIDVSGSMESPNRLPLVKSSLKLLTNNLREKDRVSIVVYAGAAGEALPSTSGADKQKIFEALDGLNAGGSTAGGTGIELAYQVAQKNLIKGGNNRVILCTDGDFNVGVSSEKGLESLIEEKRQTGIYLTVLGYGMGNYKDSKLQILSQKGNGNHAYIDNLQEANRVLVQEFGSTMYAVAKDVKMQVEFNPAYVNAYRLVGYESRLLNKEDFNDDTKDAGELGAGHTVTAFYEVIPVGVKNTYGGVDDLKYQKPSTAESVQGVKNNEMMTVKLRYKPLNSNSSTKMEIPVLVSDKNKTPSVDYTFASAVAMFGQLLRNSDFKGTATYDDVIALARKGFGEDKQGYRHEFVRLAEAMKQLDK
jgi:Ca-activated chloride channel family protein